MTCKAQQENRDQALTYQQRRQQLLIDKSTPDWVREILVSLEGRDPCDVLNGLEVLVELYTMKFNESAQRAVS